MKSENIFNPAIPKQATAFNNQSTFANSAHIVTPNERDAALEQIQKLVDHTKATIQDHE